jgi:hypothetical protein
MYTGPAVAGSVGYAERLKYLILGKAVQMALTIQQWKENEDKTLVQPTGVLAGETTVRYLDTRFTTQKVGEVGLDETNHSIGVYQLIEMEPSGREPILGARQ